MTTSPRSSPSRLDPALLTGIFVGLSLLALEFVSFESMSRFFGHPRLIVDGEIPANTARGIDLLYMLLPVAALAWIATPIASRLPAHAEPPTNQRIARRDGWILLGLLLAGGFLRVLRLEESLWYDEIAALTSFSIYGPGPALGNYYALSNHVLHSALVSMSTEVAGGVSESIVRTPALLFGTLSIPAGFLLGREAGSPRTGLLLASAIAVMPVAVLESVEARGYSMMLFFALLAHLFFLCIDRNQRGMNLLGYAAVVTLGTWSHLVFACIPIAHGILALFGIVKREGRTAAIQQLLALCLAGVSTFTALSPIIPDLLQIRENFGATDGNEPTLLGPEGLHAVLQIGGAWSWWAALPGLALVGMGVFGATTSRMRRSLLVTGLAGVVAVVLAVVGDSWLYARFLVFMLAFSGLAFACGLDRFAGKPRPGAVIALLVLAAWIIDLAVRPGKQPIREGVNTLAQLVDSKNRTALSLGLAENVADYYAQPLEISLIPTGSLGNELPPLEAAPDLAIMLYPDLHPESVHDRLEAAGYRETTRHEGWLDWGHGDVVILRRSGG